MVPPLPLRCPANLYYYTPKDSYFASRLAKLVGPRLARLRSCRVPSRPAVSGQEQTLRFFLCSAALSAGTGLSDAAAAPYPADFPRPIPVVIFPGLWYSK